MFTSDARSSTSVCVQAPNHLGDGVMALPALEALIKKFGKVVISAPQWGPDLYGHLNTEVIPIDVAVPCDVVVLFPPSFRVAWKWFRYGKRRVGVRGDWRRLLLTDVVSGGLHQLDTYGNLVLPLDVQVHDVPRYRGPVRKSEVVLPEDHVGLNPISKSGDVREWKGFSELANLVSAPVIFYGGPGEDEAVQQHAGTYPAVVGLSLPEFAGALQQCAVFVSNDSGAAHFARACGVKTVVVYGSTTPERSGPSGAGAVMGPPVACHPCYRSRCAYSLECLDIPTQKVFLSIQEALGEGPSVGISDQTVMV